MNDTERRIRTILNRVGGIPEDASDTADLYLDLGLASVHALQMLTELEEGFSIHIPDERFVEATSISRLSDIVSELASARVGRG